MKSLARRNAAQRQEHNVGTEYFSKPRTHEDKCKGTAEPNCHQCLMVGWTDDPCVSSVGNECVLVWV